MSNELTDKAFWAGYWESKKDLAFNVPANYTFHKLLKNIIDTNKPASAIELGGFPGYFAIFFEEVFRVKNYAVRFLCAPKSFEGSTGCQSA